MTHRWMHCADIQGITGCVGSLRVRVVVPVHRRVQVLLRQRQAHQRVVVRAHQPVQVQRRRCKEGI